MLLQIRGYIQTHRSATMADLANHFRVAPEALRGMLDHWIAKGVVARFDLTPSCSSGCASGSCGGCGVAGTFELYEWCGAGAVQR